MQDTQEKAVQVRFSQSLFSAIESWRREQPIIPSRPAAIRALLQRSLTEPAESDRERGRP